MSRASIIRSLAVLCLVQDFCAAQYTPSPRWGQAVALVENIVFVQGGRTDPYNTYSYTSAPVDNALLSLPLTSSFNMSSPPWVDVTVCSNCTPSQGPAVSWHTLSAINTSTLLSFGGDQDTTAHIPESADSAALLTIANTASPIWQLEATSWASEPDRRMYHSASSTGGKIFIVGGEKTDGSGSGYSDHYVFNPSIPSFTQLSSTNGPPDIYGHASIVLSNGSMIVFGGYSQSQDTLFPLTTIWMMDTTQSAATWTTAVVTGTIVPSPRRNFAATLLEGGQILIHGGADAQVQTTYSDGWILDTGQAPWTWSSIGALSELGSRHDHFAVGLGTQVVFGFGYMANGPAPAALQLFDLSTGAFASSYSPPASVTSPSSNTIPGPVPTIATGSSQPSGSGQSSAGHSASTSVSGSTGGASGTSGGPGSQNTDGSGGSGGDGSPHSSHTTAIALGTVFGSLGLLAGASATVLYVRRRHSAERFHRIGPSDDDENISPGGGVLPVAGAREKRPALQPAVQNVKTRLTAMVPHRSDPPQQRRDMFADEDQMFDAVMVRRDASSGQSSWSSGPHRHGTVSSVVHDSLASLRSVGGSVLAYAAGSRGMRSREASTGSRNAAWLEKDDPELYEDSAALIGEGAISRSAARTRGGHQAPASVHSYADPFADYTIEAFEPPAGALSDDYDDSDLDYDADGPPSLLDPPPRPYYAHAKAPRAATTDLTRLSPLAEQPSVSTLTQSDPSSDSHTFPLNSSSESRSSRELPRSPRPRPSSILDANTPPTQPIRRSDSWWARFTKTPLLDRRASDAGRRQSTSMLDFRDPQPAPRLIAIEESGHSNQVSASDAPPPPKQRVYASAQLGRSASSLQTARSEMLEHVGRTMDIVQRGTASSHGSEPSRATTAEEEQGLRPAFSRRSSSSHYVVRSDSGDGSALVQSPGEMETFDPAVLPPPLAIPRHLSTGPPSRPASGAQVAARVQAFERRMSQPDVGTGGGATGRPRRASVYGVAPRPSLFVANPDHRAGASGDSA